MTNFHQHRSIPTPIHTPGILPTNPMHLSRGMLRVEKVENLTTANDPTVTMEARRERTYYCEPIVRWTCHMN